MKGLQKWEAAAIEAEEEAGLIGKIETSPIGVFHYFKRKKKTFKIADVEVFRLWTVEQKGAFKESDQREFRWMRPEDAVLMVDEPSLKTVIAAVIDKENRQEQAAVELEYEFQITPF